MIAEVIAGNRNWFALNEASESALIQIPECSIDALVTDPPSGISFMGREWDSDKGGRAHWITWLAGIMGHCFRVLKPGGHGVVWALPRTSHWTATALEDAGFEIRDMIQHWFGNGFPKSMNVSKALDKKRDDRGGILVVTGFIREARDRAGFTNQMIDDVFGMNGMAGHWTTNKSQPAVPTWEQWLELKFVLGMGTEMDAEVWRLNGRKGQPGEAWKEREVTGMHEQPPAAQIWRENVDGGANLTPKERRDLPKTEEAIRWHGWGTALKPASEIWWMVRKPLEGTTVDNLRKYGVGAINIEASRLDGPKNVPESPRRVPGTIYGHLGRADGTTGGFDPDVGRWPPHLILSHAVDCIDGGECDPSCPVAELDRQSGESTSQTIKSSGSSPTTDLVYGKFAQRSTVSHDDEGGASRFFPVFRPDPGAGFLYTPKPARSEKEAGLDTLPSRSGSEITGRKEGSAGSQNPRAGAGARRGARNIHPTVKSVDLMRWLVRLVTPPGGVVLDPFAGSGTTMVAALQLGMRAIGIEKEGPYFEILQLRVQEDLPLFNRLRPQSPAPAAATGEPEAPGPAEGLESPQLPLLPVPDPESPASDQGLPPAA